MSIPRYRSRFKVPGSRFRVANLELGTWNFERRKSLGLSLVELIVFIVVVGTAVAGVLAALNVATRGSADPMIQKQALAIAEAVLEEAQLMPFTYCDPDDANAATAVNQAACATPEVTSPPASNGPEGGETRLGGITPFDNVNDYNNFTMAGGIVDIAGNAVPGLAGYTASVTVLEQGLGGIAGNEALLLTVTVTGPGNVSVVLHGYRTRYAPNALP